MRTRLLAGLCLVALIGAGEGEAVAATPAAALDLSAEYARYSCHGPQEAAPGELGPPEAQALAASSGRARRKAGVLTVGPARFADNPADNDGYAKYRYRGAFAQPAFDVVEGSHYEWTTWTLVDPKCVTHQMQSPPMPSPDGAGFVGASDDAVHGNGDVVEIVAYANGKFSSQTVEAPFPCDPHWIDRDTIALKILPNGATRVDDVLEGLVPASAWKTARIVRRGAAWVLVPPAR